MTEQTEFPEVVIVGDDIFVDGELIPYLAGDEITLRALPHGVTFVTVQILAGAVAIDRGDKTNTEPEMTQTEAHDIFRRRNPAAFPQEPSA